MRDAAGSLYIPWIAANALAEMLGLGATFAVGAAVMLTPLGADDGPPGALVILLMTLAGAFEGCTVGGLQWRVLRRAFPSIRWQAWIAATLAGALVAWLFGSMAFALMGAGMAEVGTAAAAEPPTWLIWSAAAGMGLPLGMILALAQWLVLRRAARGAWVWLLANAAAWALGMPLIFVAIDLAQAAGSVPGVIAVMAAGLALTGAVVGAVHGAALVRLAAAAPRVQVA